MFLPSRSRNKLNFFLYICLFFNFKAASSEDSAGFKNDSNNIKVPSMTYVKDHSTMSQIQPKFSNEIMMSHHITVKPAAGVDREIPGK